MQVLVTGGAGYIGSHCCVALIEAGYQPLILDNLSNSSRAVVGLIERIAGRRPGFIEGDVRDGRLLDRVFADHEIGGVIHFAALKAVGESVARPLEYFDNNVHGTLSLLTAMRRAGVKTFVFSSSATVYGEPDRVPITEDFPRSATNPYGRSKLMTEDILGDLAYADPEWRIARLRYFNPAGAHESGLIGEDPRDIPNNLMPFIAQVAIGRREQLMIFGDDYPTRDGTGVRDYIHVMDLAEAHVAALEYLKEKGGVLTVNLGTGAGVSVLEMVRAFERASGRAIPCRIVGRRPGDVAECWADPTLANRLLGWKARRSLDQICADTWRWQSLNPDGYRDIEYEGVPGDLRSPDLVPVSA
jgi:UDP-glucose 4-epimerase